MANMCSSDCDIFSIDNLPKLETSTEKALLTIDQDLQRLAIEELRAVDNQSEWCSSDSGKGSSEIATPDSINEPDVVLAAPWHVSPAYNAFTAYSETMGAVMPCHAMIYEFEIPQLIVGRLIGKHGTYVNKIKEITGANIIVKRHHNNLAMKICAIEGLCAEIEGAIGMIRERFPMKRYPFLHLEQLNHQRQIPASTAISFLPPNNKLNLIEGVVNDVSISCVVSVNHLFVQQPTHPTFPSLSRLHEALMSVYEQSVGAPKLIRPFNVGVICVARLAGGWFRAEVVTMHEDNEKVTIRLVDGGGYVVMPIEELRQIRFDFVTIPFQCTECKLADVCLLNESTELGEEARKYFENICQGQVLQAHIVGYSFNETLIYLYRMGEDQIPVLVNQELVKKGLAEWVDYSLTETASNETDKSSKKTSSLLALT